MKRILIILATIATALALMLGANPASAQYLEGDGGDSPGGGGTPTSAWIEVVAPGSLGGGGGAPGTGAGTTGGGGALARTGSNVLPLVGIGGAALLLGAAFIYGARKPSEA